MSTVIVMFRVKCYNTPMNYTEIQKKWKEIWAKRGTNRFNPDSPKPKYYALKMFPYPSAANLHMGHVFNFAPADTHARFRRMCGYNVLQPMGFDSFGLPSENYSLKNGTHPMDDTDKNVARFRDQLDNIGGMYDWDYTVVTSNPEYYKWTQWLFLQLYDAGLAYQKEAQVNWCDGCKTVLANEQVVDGGCERCSAQVDRRHMKQWFFKITEYADKLIDDLVTLDWPKKTKAMQENWIGRSEGAKITWKIADKSCCLETFTTRIDTIHSVTFVVVAPEHPILNEIVTKDRKERVEKYIKQVSKKSDIERMEHNKTGEFTGAYVIHPLTNEKVPVWVADYVLYNYGTGVVMGVPAYDERDNEFAEKYKISVVKAELVDATKTLKEMQKRKFATPETTYRLRDWSIGRQRYWGAPIPIVYCDKCGVVPVPVEQLPVVLPKLKDFKPRGAAPLANSADFVNCKCPKCGMAAKREIDTMDTFCCSSWYFLRYPNVKMDTGNMPFDVAHTNKWLPVDKYTGGAEHACGHLLQARFITKFLHDRGFLKFTEPAKSLVHQGMILASDGAKMSKSKGNVVSPDKYLAEFGSDILRLYMLFGFNYRDGGPWSEDTLKTMTRFAERVERVVARVVENGREGVNKEVAHVRANTIKCVREDLANFSFNTAMARCMEYINALTSAKEISREEVKDLVLLTAPMMPHIAEEFMCRVTGIFESNQKWKSVFDMDYPVADEKYLMRDTVEIAVQVNSKIKGRVVVKTNATQKEVEKVCENFLDGQKAKKVIYIEGKLINFIV